jgi:hypothetical protein
MMGAFSTVPRELMYLSGTTRQTFEGMVRLGAYEEYLTRIKDGHVWGIRYPIARPDPATPLQPLPSSALVEGYLGYFGSGFLTQGGHYRLQDAGVWADVHIQYDYYSSRSIIIKVEGAEQSEDPVGPDPNTLPDPPDPAQPTLAGYPERLIPFEGDNPPVAPSSPSPYGDTELWVGSTLVDSAQRFSQGNVWNPYQTIMVASTFHSNSGYTVITYMRPKVLSSTFRTWDTEEYEEHYWSVYEYFWWQKAELWCAVIDPLGALIARWQLGAAPPEYTEDQQYYEYVKRTHFLLDWQQDFIEQFNGIILKKSLTVTCEINGIDYVFYDKDGLGVLYEEPFQDPEVENVLASSSINYQTGLVEVGFSSGSPQVYTNIEFSAYVIEVDSWLEFSYYHQAGAYRWTSYHAVVNPIYSIDAEGMVPCAPQATITEDGRYIVFACKSVNITSSGNKRVPFGQHPEAHLYPGGMPLSLVYDYGKAPMQIQVFDLWNITSMVPRAVTLPLMLAKDLEPTECIVLN